MSSTRPTPASASLRHEDADGSFRVSRHPSEFHLRLRRQAAHDDSCRVAVDLLAHEGVNPTWILTGEGSKFLVPASLPPSAPTLLLARLAGPELEQRIRAGLISVTNVLPKKFGLSLRARRRKGNDRPAR